MLLHVYTPKMHESIWSIKNCIIEMPRRDSQKKYFFLLKGDFPIMTTKYLFSTALVRLMNCLTRRRRFKS